MTQTDRPAITPARSSLVRMLMFAALTVLNCWLWMQGVHEFGHVAAAVATGGHVKCVVWQAHSISRTDVAPNPHPLPVCWSGPILGCVVPLLMLAISEYFSESVGTIKKGLLRFFAGFCCVANGAYISVGSIDRIGDAGVLLQSGSPIWLLWLAGGTGVAAGFIIWHRIGRLTDLKQLSVSGRDLSAQVFLLIATLLIQAAFFSSP